MRNQLAYIQLTILLRLKPPRRMRFHRMLPLWHILPRFMKLLAWVPKIVRYFPICMNHQLELPGDRWPRPQHSGLAMWTVSQVLLAECITPNALRPRDFVSIMTLPLPSSTCWTKALNESPMLIWMPTMETV